MRVYQGIHFLFLCVVLLLVHSCSTSLAVSDHHRCIHDFVKQFVGPTTNYSILNFTPTTPASAPQTTAVVAAEAQVQAVVSKAKEVTVKSTWESIRIKFFLVKDGNVFTGKQCTDSLPTVTTIFGRNINCTSEDILTPEKENILMKEILPKAAQMHADRLFVNPLTSNLTVPAFDKAGLCGQFNIPEDHKSTGVADADMVLYVTASPIGRGTFAWAAACATTSAKPIEAGSNPTSPKLRRRGRPVIGVMNFSPRYIANTPHTIRVAAHEMAHTLGFSVDDMQNLSMVQHGVPVRDKTRSSLVTSVNTKASVKAHYNCSDVVGMELQNGVPPMMRKAPKSVPPPVKETLTAVVASGEPPVTGDIKNNIIVEKERDMPISWDTTSHWRRRNAKDELMTGVVGAGYYTAITMGAFADMGFYKVNWTKAEPMSWGRNSGCQLFAEKCVNNGQTRYSSMFCVEKTTEGTFQCTSDRTSLGQCLIMDLPTEIPEQYRYFTEPQKGSSPLAQMDYCPFIAALSGAGCMDGQESTIPGSIIGPNSRCVKGVGLKHNNAGIGDVCVQVSCTDNNVNLWYKGGKKWHSCTEGTELQLNGVVLSGKIVCPKYSDVCLTLSNPTDKTAPEVVPEEPAAQPEAPRGSSSHKSQDHTGDSAGTDNRASTTASTAKAQEKVKRNAASGPMSSTAVLLVLALTVSTVIGMTVV